MLKNLDSLKSKTKKNGKAKILVIDDDKDIREIIKLLLEALGYKIFTAENGSDAIDIFKEKNNEIDLVLLDMMIPEMDSEQIFLALKKIKPDVKTVLSSGYKKNSKAEKIIDKGVLGFIQKPYHLDELSNVISDVIKKSH